MNPMKMKHSMRTKAGAFTIIEIVLAIGIVSFAFLGVVGLLPAGMSVFRKSMDASIGAQLVQQVLTEAQQTEFELLTRGYEPAPGDETPPPAYYEYIPIRYFDDEGTELPVAKAAESLYQVRAVVQNLPKFPDNTNKNTIEMNDLASVVVQVATNPGRRVLTTDPTNLLWTEMPGVTIQSHPVIVSHHD
jgi:uncharacterized protein (TIGR02598 family)